MNDIKDYFALDEIGFIGTQSRSAAQIKRDAKKTAQYIKDLKAGKKPVRRSTKKKTHK